VLLGLGLKSDFKKIHYRNRMYNIVTVVTGADQSVVICKHESCIQVEACYQQEHGALYVMISFVPLNVLYNFKS
jgi:hypothetical protein